MEEVTNASENLNISGDSHKRNRIQVSNSKRPLFSYVNLAKRYIQQHNDVELSALGMDGDKEQVQNDDSVLSKGTDRKNKKKTKSKKHSVSDINSTEEPFVNADGDKEQVQHDDSVLSKGTDSRHKKKTKSKKRSTADINSIEEPCVNADANNEEGVEFDMSEPTMAEKLATIDLVNEDKSKSNELEDPCLIVAPPSADSVHVMLKQALHADDHTLLLDCLYSRDEKVISKSTSLLNPSDVLKLLKSLTSMVQQRGAVLVCALPWLKSILRQHASSIASQESSLRILNSLYQLIESRISTFQPALQLSTSLDILSARIPDNEVDGEDTVQTIVYDVKDSDEEDDEDDEDAMETDEDDKDLGDVVDYNSDLDGNEIMGF